MRTPRVAWGCDWRDWFGNENLQPRCHVLQPRHAGRPYYIWKNYTAACLPMATELNHVQRGGGFNSQQKQCGQVEFALYRPAERHMAWCVFLTTTVRPHNLGLKPTSSASEPRVL